jgi:mannose-binding lectin 2
MYKKEDEWTPCFDVPDIKLPGVTYLGFSAETGELSDNHDIIKVETKNLYSPSGAAGTPKDYSKNAYKPNQYAKKEGSSGGWGWFLLKFVLFGLVVTGGYVGFTVFRANRRRDRF